MLLVANISFGAIELTERLRLSQLATVALRNHTNADMMHDALRADVYAALNASAIGAERRDDIVADGRRHAEEFRRLMAANYALTTPPEVRQTLESLETPINDYIAVVEAITTSAFENTASARRLIPDFETRFSTLELTMAEAGDRIESFSRAQTADANAFSMQAKWVSALALFAGLFIGAFVVWVTHFDVLLPLAALGVALQRLANGDHRTVLPTSRRDEVGQMARTIEMFGRASLERGRLSRETRILSELNEWLQSAKSEAELYQIVAKFMSHFLPDSAGAIYIYANSRDVLECAKTWNGAEGAETMHPDDCWSLRRGRTFTHGHHEIEFACAHVSPDCDEHYCCIPVLAHGETVGLLHLEYAPRREANSSESDAANRHDLFSEQKRLGLAAAEHISLAIANMKLREQLRDQSIRDALTGLCNRRYLLETCRREFLRADRSRRPLAMLSIDVDHFKTFNDNHGHDAGDTVLRSVGEALSSVFRGDDIPCRFGGEEFVVLLPGASASAAALRAEEARARIEALRVRYADSDLPRITISVGVATYPEGGATPLEVLKVADNALYAAKRLGRNRVELSESCRASAEGEAPLHPLAALTRSIADQLAACEAGGAIQGEGQGIAFALKA
jgi:diguanylate cyclase (GGDEF)-like protein